jgi:hypothetical protein
MNYRVFDSDGVFKGGLFNTAVYSSLSHRVWYAPPHPHYGEKLYDISPQDEPCEASSFFILRIAFGNDGFPRMSEEEEFDPHSHAVAITPREAEMWLIRNGYSVPEDLEQLLDASDESQRSDEQSRHDPMMPASWFKDKFGVPEDRLRSAYRRNQLRRIQRGSRVFYSVRGAAELKACTRTACSLSFREHSPRSATPPCPLG